MSCRSLVCCFVTLLTLGASGLSAADWSGQLKLTVNGDAKAGGKVTVDVASVRSKGGKDTEQQGQADGREMRFELVPWRFNLFDDTVSEITAARRSPTSFDLTLPNDLRAGWYLLLGTIADDDGVVHPSAKASRDRNFKKYFTRKLVAVHGGSDESGIRLHTERARCVYSVGEPFRVFVSGRRPGALDESVVVALYPSFEGVKPMAIAKGQLKAGAGAAGTIAFDIGAATSSQILPGDWKLAVIAGGKAVDTYSVRFVSPDRPSGGTRWAHTMNGTLDGSAALPQVLNGGSLRNYSKTVLKRIHNANFWNHFFANGFPVVGPTQALPDADDPKLPPAQAFYRPSLTHAFYQSLMADGIALGITSGYGEDYRAEVYMPIPTQVDDDIQTMARKYQVTGLGAAQYPNFVAIYADYYGHMDYDGAGELTGAETKEIREGLWRDATAAAGMKGALPPYNFPLDRKKMPKAMQDLLKDKKKSKAFGAYLNGKRDEHGGDKKWFANHYKTESARMNVWKETWAAAGVSPVPEAPRRIPTPRLDEGNTERFGKQAEYDYTSHALRGLSRGYGAFTRAVEEELPAVFTIHNKGTMNHSSVSHSWTGTRTPNVDPAYLAEGATAISVSEWNLDSVPKPYFLTTFYNRFLVDRGHPVFRCGLWKQAGSPNRWMRDAVFWGGRQIQTYYDQTGNMTWSHKGSDQTTYASNERMASVTEFLTYYSDLFPRLEPVREIGLYVPPVGGPWGTGVTRGHYVAMIASLMSDHQVHMVSHGDIPDGRLAEYPALYAPSIHGRDSFYPFEKKGLNEYLGKGGKIVVSQAPNYYHDEADYTRYGISHEKVPAIDANTGQVRKNKDGSTRMESKWTETKAQWAKVTREVVWGDFKGEIIPAEINVHEHFTHLEDGEQAKWTGSHWTGHHKWAPYRGGALYQYKDLAKAFDQVLEPLVRKDQPEVFVNAARPRSEDGEGLFLFASNWTLPTEPDLFTRRIPQGFFKSSVLPVVATLKVKADGIGAIYDIIDGREVPFEREGDRIVLKAELDSVEGRIFACYPEAIATSQVALPAQVQPGQLLRGRLQRIGASGAELAVMGSARVRLMTADGRVLQDLRRAVAGDGLLPAVRIPAGIETLRYEVIDTITGRRMETELKVAAQRLPGATAADAVTVHRGSRVHDFLKGATNLRIVVDDGNLSFKDGAVSVTAPNPHKAEEERWAKSLAAALGKAGIKASVVGSAQAVAGPLYAHPWTGKMAGARTRGTVPNVRIDGPVLVVGSTRTNGHLSRMERANVLPRSIGADNVGQGRAVISWAARAFSPTGHTVVVAVDDEAGLAAASKRLVALAKADPGTDPFYAARESARFRWTPTEVVRFKAERRGLRPFLSEQDTTGNDVVLPLGESWNELATVLGTAVFSLDASEAGVAVGTKSWIKPTGLLSADGEVKGFFGGAAEVTPRDVSISADGRSVAAGYSLLGRVAAYGNQDWEHTSGIVYKPDNAFSWDTFKDSDRQLGVDPTNRIFLAATSDALIAYDSNSGAERWRLPVARSLARPQGHAQPEMAFSDDGSRVLVAPLVEAKRGTASFEVETYFVDPKTGKSNKREKSKKTVSVPVRVLETRLQLLDTASGKPVWQKVTTVGLEHAETGDSVYKPGKPAEFRERIAGRNYTWKATGDGVPKLDGTAFKSTVEQTLPFWHLYSAIGPKGSWTIAGTREAKFSILDEKGSLLRTWEPRHLPRALSAGDMIPPTYLAGKAPKRLGMFAAQTRSFFLFDLQIGTAAQRATAKKAEDENIFLVNTIKGELRNTKNYGNYGKKDYLAAFDKKIAALPGDLRKDLIDRMARVPAERRAGRKRDYRFFQPIVERVESVLYREDAALLDQAVGLNERLRISLPDRIVDAEVDAGLTTAIIGLWDGTVRAYDLADGSERWATPVIGGCQVAVVRNASGAISAIYAGGSRGDVYRLDPATGSIQWQRNITAETNSLD